MLGLPDDMMVSLHSINPDGAWAFRIPGNAHFFPNLEESHRARLMPVHFGPNLKSPFKCPSRATLVNNVADADTSGKSLRMLERMVEQSGSACFNHPTAILHSAREIVAGKLSSIPGVLVARTVRARLEEPADLEIVMRDAGLEFPIIVRNAGIHGGSSTVKIDSADEIRSRLKNLPWGGRDIYVSQYLSYADDDGYHRKMRLVVVGREVFLRHMIVADDWHVNANARMAASIDEETRALTSFETTLLPHLRDRTLAIADALALDYFGIDCNLRPDGSLLVFEANAAMAILLNSSPTPNIWEKTIDTIRGALAELLFDPSRWRHQVKTAQS